MKHKAKSIKSKLIPNNYNGKTAEQIWNGWDQGQRLHFLNDHYLEFSEPIQDDYNEYVTDAYNKLDRSIVLALKKHISNGQYEHGGSMATGGDRNDKNKNESVTVNYKKGDEVDYRLENGKIIKIIIDSKFMKGGKDNRLGYEAIFTDDGKRYFADATRIIDTYKNSGSMGAGEKLRNEITQKKINDIIKYINEEGGMEGFTIPILKKASKRFNVPEVAMHDMAYFHEEEKKSNKEIYDILNSDAYWFSKSFDEQLNEKLEDGGSLFSKAKALAKSGAAKAKSAYEKATPHVKAAYEKTKDVSKRAVKTVKQKIHDQKLDIAQDVINETLMNRGLSEKHKKPLYEAEDIIQAEYKDGGKPEKIKKCPVGTKVQSLLLSKDRFKSEKAAKDWAHSHGFKFGNVDEKDNNYRLRQEEPEEFKKPSFRTITITNNVQAVIGCPIGQSTVKSKMAAEHGGVYKAGGEIDKWDDKVVNKMYDYYLDELSDHDRQKEEKNNLTTKQKREVLKKQQGKFEKSFNDGGISQKKAKTILHEGKAHGYDITDKQRRFFGARASGYPVKSKEDGGYENGGTYKDGGNISLDDINYKKSLIRVVENAFNKISHRSLPASKEYIKKQWNFLPKGFYEAIQNSKEFSYKTLSINQILNGTILYSDGINKLLRFTWKYKEFTDLDKNFIEDFKEHQEKMKGILLSKDGSSTDILIPISKEDAMQKVIDKITLSECIDKKSHGGTYKNGGEIENLEDIAQEIYLKFLDRCRDYFENDPLIDNIEKEYGLVSMNDPGAIKRSVKYYQDKTRHKAGIFRNAGAEELAQAFIKASRNAEDSLNPLPEETEEEQSEDTSNEDKAQIWYDTVDKDKLIEVLVEIGYDPSDFPFSVSWEQLDKDLQKDLIKYLVRNNIIGGSPEFRAGGVIRKGTNVIFDKKPGKVIDKTFDDGIVMLHIEYEDGTTEWEAAEDVKMKIVKKEDGGDVYAKGGIIRVGTNVIFDKKPGKVIWKDKEQGTGIVMVNIEYEDGTTSWEVADDDKMKIVKNKK